MRILFIMRHSGYVRNFEPVLRLLCERGHHVHLAFHTKMREWLLYTSDIGQQLSAVYPHFSQGMAPIRNDGWGMLGHDVRFGLDYLRYLEPAYRDAPKLRRRVERDTAGVIVRHAQRGPAARAWLARALRAIDRSIPRSREIDRYMDEQRPDLLLVTPLVEPGSPQADYVRSARARGIRTVFCVASWDNLTNKGVIHDPLDLVTVWNEEMKREAVELHAVPAERVAVTGAQPFDHWFEWQPASTRERFCARVGLRPDRPYVLYLCSSKFVAPDETPFVRRWVEQLRASSSEVLREAGVLVRPHPQNTDVWREFDGTGLENFAVYPPAGSSPADAATRAEYFDSIHHSAAVVGVNTTAEIESAIIGRSVYTILAPEFRETQDGTLHFHHLKRNDGGLVHVASNFPDHLAQLEAALQGGDRDAARAKRFVETFVRPQGVDVPSTPRFVEALEALGAQPAPRPAGAPPWSYLVRLLMAPLAVRLQRELTAATQAKLERAAEERVRKAAVKVAQKATASAAIAVPRPAVAEEPSDRAPRAGARSTAVADLVTGFAALKPADRGRFVRQIAPSIPAELWFDLREGSAEPLDFPDTPIQLRVTSKPERLRLRACAKEPWTVDWIRYAVGTGDVFYDVGANVGAYSLVAAKKTAGASRVVAFEASYENVAALCANIVLNDVADRVTPLPVALANVNSLSVFNLLSMAPGAARHSLDGNAAEGPPAYAQPVLTYRLDDLVALLGLPAPTHLKLDVDGGELAVLDGAARTLASPCLRSMLLEVSTELSEAVTHVLETHGFRLHSRVRVQNTDGEFRVWYGLFARPDVILDTRIPSGDHLVVR